MIEHMFDSRNPGAPGGLALLERCRERIAQHPDPLSSMPEPSAATPSAVLAALSTSRVASTLDWERLDHDEAAAAVLGLEAAQRAIGAALSAGMEHLENEGQIKERSGLNPPEWLAQQTRGSIPACKRSRRIGRTLAQFPKFADAIACGDLSTNHADVLDAVSNPRIIDRLVEAENTIFELAMASTFEEFRRGMRVIASRLDEDGAEPDCSQRDQVAMTRGSDGKLHVRGTFSGDHAVCIEEALRSETSREFRRAANDEEHGGACVPATSTLRARAFAELMRRGMGLEPGSGSAPRSEAIVVTQADDATAACCVDGEPLDPATAALLTCDAQVNPVVFDPRGEVVWVGRSSRLATPALRRALVTRDGGCVFPGCQAPPGWCDAHHIVLWKDGGTTDPQNMALLCRFHHRLVHLSKWMLSVEAGKRMWTGPDGRRLCAQNASTRGRFSRGDLSQR